MMHCRASRRSFGLWVAVTPENLGLNTKSPLEGRGGETRMYSAYVRFGQSRSRVNGAVTGFVGQWRLRGVPHRLAEHRTRKKSSTALLDSGIGYQSGRTPANPVYPQDRHPVLANKGLIARDQHRTSGRLLSRQELRATGPARWAGAGYALECRIPH